MRIKPYRKFTLIEMLVVVAIIGILAALLMPALQRSVEMAKQINCLNRIKQCGVAIGMYHDDYHAFIPWIWPKGDWNKLTNWGAFVTGIPTTTMYPYTGPGYTSSISDIRCPYQPPYGTKGSANVGYGVNFEIGNWPGVRKLPGISPWQGLDFGPIVRLGSVQSPSALPLLADTVWGPNGWNYVPDQQNQFWVGNKSSADKNSIHLRHVDGANFLFMDFHASNLKPGVLELNNIAYYRFMNYALWTP